MTERNTHMIPADLQESLESLPIESFGPSAPYSGSTSLRQASEPGLSSAGSRRIRTYWKIWKGSGPESTA